MTYDARLDTTNTMGVVDGTTDADRIARPGQPVLVVDALSQRFQELLNGIAAWYDVVWTGSKITTQAYLYCGGENAWLVALAFNGIGTPMELRAGMVLRMPASSEIDRVLKLLATDAGTVVGTPITI